MLKSCGSCILCKYLLLGVRVDNGSVPLIQMTNNYSNLSQMCVDVTQFN